MKIIKDMAELTKWYFIRVWEKPIFEESIFVTWFGRLWGTLLSPFLLFLALIILIVIKIVDIVEDRKWQ